MPQLIRDLAPGDVVRLLWRPALMRALEGDGFGLVLSSRLFHETQMVDYGTVLVAPIVSRPDLRRTMFASRLPGRLLLDGKWHYQFRPDLIRPYAAHYADIQQVRSYREKATHYLQQQTQRVLRHILPLHEVPPYLPSDPDDVFSYIPQLGDMMWLTHYRFTAGEGGKRRPIVILSSGEYFLRTGNFWAMPLTSVKSLGPRNPANPIFDPRDYPALLHKLSEGELDRITVLNWDDVRPRQGSLEHRLRAQRVVPLPVVQEIVRRYWAQTQEAQFRHLLPWPSLLRTAPAP